MLARLWPLRRSGQLREMSASSSVEARVLEAWSKLHNYAVNFDFEVGVQPLSNWQAPAVRRALPRCDSSCRAPFARGPGA